MSEFLVVALGLTGFIVCSAAGIVFFIENKFKSILAYLGFVLLIFIASANLLGALIRMGVTIK